MTSHTILRKKARLKNNPKRITVVEYLLKRLGSFGIRHLFGTKHPYLESIKLRAQKIAYIEVPNGLCAMNLADGYAKGSGFSAIAVVKKTPGFIDAIIHASNESIAQVIILVTHAKDQNYPVELKKLCAGWTVLDDPKTAAKKIDRMIDCSLHFQKPVCIELHHEIAERTIGPHQPQRTEFSQTDQNSLQDFLLDVDELLSKAKYPAIFSDRLISAHHVEDDLKQFAKRYNIPMISSGPCDLLFAFSEKTIEEISYTHLVRVTLQDAFCDERHYSDLFFKDVVESLSSLECRKYFKSVKERTKALTLVMQIISDIASKRKCLIVSSIEYAIGLKLANSAALVLAAITEDELHNSFYSLQLAQKLKLNFVVCVTNKSDPLQDNYDWNLTELAHLFVDERGVQIQSPKGFEKALHMALDADDGIYLIDATLLDLS